MLFAANLLSAGTVLVIVLVALAIVLAVLFRRDLRHLRMVQRLQHGRCPGCGYTMKGNPARRCPECGHDLPPVAERWASMHLKEPE